MPIVSGKAAAPGLGKQEGVRVMFGNPGTTELPLMDALATETAAPLRAEGPTRIDVEVDRAWKPVQD